MYTGYTRVYRGIQGYIAVYKGIPGVYKGLQGYVGVYKGIQAYTRGPMIDCNRKLIEKVKRGGNR